MSAWITTNLGCAHGQAFLQEPLLEKLLGIGVDAHHQRAAIGGVAGLHRHRQQGDRMRGIQRLHQRGRVVWRQLQMAQQVLRQVLDALQPLCRALQGRLGGTAQIGGDLGLLLQGIGTGTRAGQGVESGLGLLPGQGGAALGFALAHQLGAGGLQCVQIQVQCGHGGILR